MSYEMADLQQRPKLSITEPGGHFDVVRYAGDRSSRIRFTGLDILRLDVPLARVCARSPQTHAHASVMPPPPRRAHPRCTSRPR